MGKWIFKNGCRPANAPFGAFIALCAILATSGASAAENPRLALVVGAAEASYPDRIAAIKELGKSLSAEEIALLYGFLKRKTDEGKAQPDELNAIKNDVVNVLKKQKVMPADLAGHLIAMCRDRSQDAVWRDYCVQHLGDIYTAIGSREDQAAACRMFWDAADENEGSIPGTALIAINNLCGRNGFERDRIAAKALEMVRNPAYGEPAKITSLQICAGLGQKSVLPDARKLAATASIPVRVSALACLGALGDKSDLPLLERYAAGTDVRLKMAALAAVEKLTGGNRELSGK